MIYDANSTARKNTQGKQETNAQGYGPKVSRPRGKTMSGAISSFYSYQPRKTQGETMKKSTIIILIGWTIIVLYGIYLAVEATKGL